MHRLTELIHSRHLLHPVPGDLHHLQISGKACHLTGDIHDPVRSSRSSAVLSGGSRLSADQAR